MLFRSSFLVNAWDRRRGAFRYSHDPSRLGSEYSTLPGSTPAALFALSLLGVDVAEGQFAPARSFVSSRAPDGYRFTTNDDFVFRAQGTGDGDKPCPDAESATGGKARGTATARGASEDQGVAMGVFV